MEERAIGEAVDVGVYRHQLTVYRETQPGGGTELEHALSFLTVVRNHAHAQDGAAALSASGLRVFVWLWCRRWRGGADTSSAAC